MLSNLKRGDFNTSLLSGDFNGRGLTNGLWDSKETQKKTDLRGLEEGDVKGTLKGCFFGVYKVAVVRGLESDLFKESQKWDFEGVLKVRLLRSPKSGNLNDIESETFKDSQKWEFEGVLRVGN